MAAIPNEQLCADVVKAVSFAHAITPAAPLRERRLTEAHLRQVQARRDWPTRMTQRLQVIVQNGVVASALGSTGRFTAPLPIRLMQRFPILRRIPARIIGLGFRPEHVRTPAV